MKLLPGIPHHGLVGYRINVPVRSRRSARLHHTADYVLQRVPPEATREELQAGLDRRAPPAQVGPVTWLEHWQKWHQRAELALQIAVERDCVCIDRQAERPKGSSPCTRPVGSGSLHRPEQTIALRRLLRLHRRYVGHIKAGGEHTPDGFLDAKHLQQYAQAGLDGIMTPNESGPPTHADALESSTTAIAKKYQVIQKQKAKEWRERFATWSKDLYKLTTPMFRPSAPAPPFGGKDMREDWHAQWCPEGYPD